MKFRVGQRVRLLHESGEGIITRLIDKNTVEVDIDDFPIDVPVDEVIPIANAETAYVRPDQETAEKIQEKKVKVIQQLGTAILDLSLVIKVKDDEQYELLLVNPEPADALFTCYLKYGKRYEGVVAGIAGSGEYYKLATLDKADLGKLKSVYFQVLLFVPGKNYPHAPIQKELTWSKARLQTPSRFFKAINDNGWAFSIRDDKQSQDVQSIAESEFVKVRQTDAPRERKEVEVDLHIEELVKNPLMMRPSEMLKTQMDHLKKRLDQAIVNQHAALIVIHGVGEGKLRKEVITYAKTIPQIKDITPADHNRYGNGATRLEIV